MWQAQVLIHPLHVMHYLEGEPAETESCYGFVRMLWGHSGKHILVYYEKIMF